MTDTTPDIEPVDRRQSELFPVDNPETTDGPGHLPRRAEAMLRLLMDEYQRLLDVTMAVPRQVVGDERTHVIGHQVNLFGLIYLLAVVRHLAPEDADGVAAALADQWDDGDLLGEWVHEWRQALDAGQPLTLPIAAAESRGDGEPA